MTFYLNGWDFDHNIQDLNEKFELTTKLSSTEVTEPNVRDFNLNICEFGTKFLRFLPTFLTTQSQSSIFRLIYDRAFNV